MCAFLGQVLPALADDEVVHAVLFYSPTCPHCYQVINEDLPPLMEKYEGQFEIVAVNTAHPDGQMLYEAAIQHFNIPLERRGVPTLIIGDAVLVGSLEIPQQLPDLIEAYLVQGGVAWPDIPGLAEALNSPEPTAEPTTVPVTPTAVVRASTATPEAVEKASPTPAEQVALDVGQPGSPGEPGKVRDLTGGVPDGPYTRFRQDPLGNSLSLLVLVGMVGTILNTTMRFWNLPGDTTPPAFAAWWKKWTILGLVLLGLGISVYMAYVETTDTSAICGPVGDCNTVQQSDYARLFGMVPVGIVGIVGYALLGLAWVIAYLCRGRCGQWSQVLLPGMALSGTLFSIYLTFLEPFVIGATCMWCLSSAVAITLILLLTVDGGQRALADLMATGPRHQ